MSWLHFTVADYGEVDHEFCVDAKTITFELKGRELYLGTLGVRKFDTQAQAINAFEHLIHELESNVTMITFPFIFQTLTDFSLSDNAEDYV